MSYELLQFPHAMRQLRQLRKTHNPRHNEIIKAIRALAENPRPGASEELVGRSGRRVRIGEYRVIYQIDDKKRTVTVIAVAHRREVYKR
jgi:mRNA interferase RelE/StbE